MRQSARGMVKKKYLKILQRKKKWMLSMHGIFYISKTVQRKKKRKNIDSVLKYEYDL